MKVVFTVEYIDNKLVVTIEPAAAIQVESKQVEPEIDWNEPVAFPKGYVLPEGVKIDAVRIYNPTNHVSVGTKGEVIGDGSEYPHFKYFDNEENEIQCKYCFIDRLAPIDPTDHPLHPKFKGNK
jgi:hypothetical protein